jgi:8-oxo-dGTP diphosphatase
MNRLSPEVKALAQRWGQPQLIERQIPVAPGLSKKMVHAFFSDRCGEVVMAIRRASDGLVWVMTKQGFPPGLYSLPTGGIRPGEEISAALWRELREETGFQVQVQRFLAAVRYEPLSAPGDPQQVPAFFSYVFLLQESNGHHPVVDCGEKILDFKAVPPGELLDIARQWRTLSGSSDAFHDLAAWGTFRSLTHRLVGQAITGGER